MAIVLGAVMLPLVLWGIAQGRGRAAQGQLGSVAEAAAQVAVSDAQASAQVRVPEHQEQCTVTRQLHVWYDKYEHQYVKWYTYNAACSTGQTRKVNATVALPPGGLSAGQWDGEVESALGCNQNNIPPSVVGHYVWWVCGSIPPLSAEQQVVWNIAPAQACNSAWQEVRYEMPGPTATNKVRMVQCFTENDPPLAHLVLEWLGPPVTVSVQATAYPTQ